MTWRTYDVDAFHGREVREGAEADEPRRVYDAVHAPQRRSDVTQTSDVTNDTMHGDRLHMTYTGFLCMK